MNNEEYLKRLMEERGVSHPLELADQEYDIYRKKEQKEKRKELLKKILFVLGYVFIYIPFSYIYVMVISKLLDYLHIPMEAQKLCTIALYLISIVIIYIVIEKISDCLYYIKSMKERNRKMTKYNFITPNGLKVRLHAPLLFSLISGNPEELSAEEMLNNAQIAGALNWIDALFSFRYCYTWYFALIFTILGNISSPHYFCGMIIIYAVGILFTLVPFGMTLIDVICHWLYFPYYICRNNVIRFGIIVVLAIVFKHPIMILWYAIFFVGYNIVDFLLTLMIGKTTKNKYGYAFADTELCAFRVVYIYLNQDSDWVKSMNLKKRSDVIRWYMEIFNYSDMPEPRIEHTENIPEDRKIGFLWHNFTDDDWNDFRERWHNANKTQQ